MIEKIIITLFVTVGGGIYLFQYREMYLLKNKRKEIKEKLKAKILFWTLDEWTGKLENIFIIGHALSNKIDYYSDINKIDEIKKELEDELDYRLSKSKEHLNENPVAKELIKEIPKIHDKQFELLINQIDDYSKKLFDGTTLLGKEDISKLETYVQIVYSDFESKLDALISISKSFIYMLRYENEISDEKVNESLLEINRLAIKTTMAMYHLQRRL